MILVPLSLYYSGVVQSKTTGANFRRRKVGKSLSLWQVRKRTTSNCDWAFSEGNIISSLQTCRLKKLNHAQTSFSACLFRAICNSPSSLCIVRKKKAHTVHGIQLVLLHEFTPQTTIACSLVPHTTSQL